MGSKKCKKVAKMGISQLSEVFKCSPSLEFDIYIRHEVPLHFLAVKCEKKGNYYVGHFRIEI